MTSKSRVRATVSRRKRKNGEGGGGVRGAGGVRDWGGEEQTDEAEDPEKGGKW